MTRFPIAGQSLVLAVSVGLSGGVTASDAQYPIAGVTPYERPANAPVITVFDKNRVWYDEALHGVTRPYPSSLRFLEDQGAWHTPFNRPGMPPPYDIRGWYQD
jgi:hypothetical protein